MWGIIQKTFLRFILCTEESGEYGIWSGVMLALVWLLGAVEYMLMLMVTCKFQCYFGQRAGICDRAG